MTKIRVVVDATPRMLKDIIEQAVTTQPDMELVACDHAIDLPGAMARSAADVVIVARPHAPMPLEHLLVENPRLKMLVVTDDGRVAQMCEFRRTRIARVTPQGLVEAIRAASKGD
ncbi:MAG: hypothetical protein ABI665_07470 [Vicinamibacterales bacterium]